MSEQVLVDRDALERLQRTAAEHIALINSGMRITDPANMRQVFKIEHALMTFCGYEVVNGTYIKS